MFDKEKSKGEAEFEKDKHIHWKELKRGNEVLERYIVDGKTNEYIHP